MLFDQLSEGGILLIPIGVEDQRMKKIRKINGKPVIEDLGAYRFVPLIGKYGQKKLKEHYAT